MTSARHRRRRALQKWAPWAFPPEWGLCRRLCRNCGMLRMLHRDSGGRSWYFYRILDEICWDTNSQTKGRAMVNVNAYIAWVIHKSEVNHRDTRSTFSSFKSYIESLFIQRPLKLHQHRPQTATNHVSTTFMRNSEFIGRPIPEKRNERKEGRQAPEPEPGTRQNQKITMEHNPLPEKRKKRKVRKKNGTLAGTRRKEEIMMEHNATTQRRQAPQPFLEPDGTTTWWWNRMPED